MKSKVPANVSERMMNIISVHLIILICPLKNRFFYRSLLSHL